MLSSGTNLNMTNLAGLGEEIRSNGGKKGDMKAKTSRRKHENVFMVGKIFFK